MFIINIHVIYKADSCEDVILVQLQAESSSPLTVIGHGQNRDLCDGAVSALHPAGTLVDGSQISVHVAGETSTAGHFLSGSRNLKGRRGW